MNWIRRSMGFTVKCCFEPHFVPFMSCILCRLFLLHERVRWEAPIPRSRRLFSICMLCRRFLKNLWRSLKCVVYFRLKIFLTRIMYLRAEQQLSRDWVQHRNIELPWCFIAKIENKGSVCWVTVRASLHHTEFAIWGHYELSNKAPFRDRGHKTETKRDGLYERHSSHHCRTARLNRRGKENKRERRVIQNVSRTCGSTLDS